MTVNAAPHATDPALSLADRLDLVDHVHHLAAALDERRFDDLGALFTADAAIRTPGGEATGRAAVVDQASRNHTQYARTQHHLTNVLVTADGDEADVRADSVAYLVREGDRPGVTMGGVYRWRALRSPQGWLFSRMVVEPSWSVDDA